MRRLLTFLCLFHLMEWTAFCAADVYLGTKWQTNDMHPATNYFLVVIGNGTNAVYRLLNPSNAVTVLANNGLAAKSDVVWTNPYVASISGQRIYPLWQSNTFVFSMPTNGNDNIFYVNGEIRINGAFPLLELSQNVPGSGTIDSYAYAGAVPVNVLHFDDGGQDCVTLDPALDIGGSLPFLFSTTVPIGLSSNLLAIANAHTNVFTLSGNGDIKVAGTVYPTNGVSYPSNSLTVAQITATITNGGFWTGPLSNVLQSVWMSNNVVKFKILAP